MDFKRRAYRSWIRVVDDATFLAVNLFHRRHAGHASTAEEIEAYAGRWAGAAPEAFFAPARLAWPLDGVPTGPVRCAVASPVATGYPENDRLVFDLFPCGRGWGRPVMLLLHGLMSVSDVGYRMWARKINAQGWHAVFVHLPYHYERRPRGYWSGELAVGPDGVRTIEGARQAVVEVRSLMAALRAAGADGFGVWGMSYGGWIGALTATMERDLRCALLLEPIVDFEHVVWRSPASAALRREITAAGVGLEQVRMLNRFVCPASRSPALGPERVHLFAAEFDRVTPPAVIASFARAWACPNFHRIPQGHVGYALMRSAYAAFVRVASQKGPGGYSC